MMQGVCRADNEHDVEPKVSSPTRLLIEAGRDNVRRRGGTPEVPTGKNCGVPHFVNGALYVLRARIEQFIDRLKMTRRVATRYDHTASSFLGFVLLAAIRQWIRFVHAS